MLVSDTQMSGIFLSLYMRAGDQITDRAESRVVFHDKQPQQPFKRVEVTRCSGNKVHLHAQ